MGRAGHGGPLATRWVFAEVGAMLAGRVGITVLGPCCAEGEETAAARLAFLYSHGRVFGCVRIRARL